jgi:predicted TIM-barrel fold metal-dependent hydrolase
MHPDDHYVVISADCHGGGEIHEYRDYLASQYHDEFDAWVDSYDILFPDLLGDLGKRNWDSDRRMHDLEADGIVAEVIFPNTIPPFFPGGALVTQAPPVDAHDLELRWAGLQAHNRWLADFCARTPGRRAGVAQILLHDVDATVEEIRRAHANGLTGGVLLQGAPPGVGLLPLHHQHYDPIWTVCEELGMPVNHHGGSAGPPRGMEQEDIVMFLLEVTWWSHNVLTNLIVGGALERHPNLQFVFTEQGTAWVPDFLGQLDYFFDRMKNAVGSQEREWGLPVVEKMSLMPSEYWARQCHIGASFMRPSEVPLRDQVGADRIMWGSDYPHKESSHPFSKEAIRLSFSDLDPDEVQALLGGNAAALYGFDLDALRPLAAGIGPTVEEVARPLSPADFPEGSQKCPAFADPKLATL